MVAFNFSLDTCILDSSVRREPRVAGGQEGLPHPVAGAEQRGQPGVEEGGEHKGVVHRHPRAGLRHQDQDDAEHGELLEEDDGCQGDGG